MKSVLRAARPVPADQIADIERQIADRTERGARLVREIEEFERERATSTDPQRILAAMAEAQARRNEIGTIDKELAELRQDLAIARDAARAARLDQLRSHVRKAAQEFVDAAAALNTVIARFQQAREAIEAAGFQREYQGLPPLPMIGQAAVISGDTLDLFAAEYARILGIRPPARAPQDPRLNPFARAGGYVGRIVAMTTMGPRVAPEPEAPPVRQIAAPQRTPGRPPLREVAEPGKALIAIIRSGVQLDDGRQLRTGDRVALAMTDAQRLVQAGAADFLSEPEPELRLIP